MKFSCTQENLSHGLNIINQLKSSNTALPILGNVLLETQKGILILTVTDLEIGIKTAIRSKIKEEGKFTVPIQIFNNYINFLPNKQVDIELEKNNLLINCEHHQTKIKGIDASEFPLIPKVEKKNKFSFKIKDLKQALHQVMIAVNPSEIRSEISGVLFNFNSPESGKATIVGTDSYRLAEKIINFNNYNNKENKKIIIPLKTLHELVNILSDTEEEIEIYLTENQILFSFNDTEVVSRLISGEYPSYQQIIPQEIKTEATCNINEFIRLIKGAGLFSRSGINDINLEFKKNKIIIYSINTQVGENKSEIEADISGEDNSITFNYHYLIDGLQNLDSDEVYISIINSKTPGIIKSPESKDYLYIIMPIGE